jgi:hypothetical protein
MMTPHHNSSGVSRFEPARFAADTLQRIRGEYLEMPGLTLNLKQAARLWQIDPGQCKALLEQLVSEGFLKHLQQHYSRV